VHASELRRRRHRPAHDSATLSYIHQAVCKADGIEPSGRGAVLSWKSWGACGIAPFTIHCGCGRRAPVCCSPVRSFGQLLASDYVDAALRTDRRDSSLQPSRVLISEYGRGAVVLLPLLLLLLLRRAESQRYHRAVWVINMQCSKAHPQVCPSPSPFGGEE